VAFQGRFRIAGKISDKYKVALYNTKIEE